MRLSPERKNLLILFLTVLATVFVGILGYKTNQKQEQSTAQTFASQQFLCKTKDIQLRLGEINFLYLKNLQTNNSSAKELINSEQELTKAYAALLQIANTNNNRTKQLDSLQPLITLFIQKIDSLSTSASAYASLIIEPVYNQIQTLITVIQNAERVKLNKSQATAKEFISYFTMAFYTLRVLIIIGLIVIFFLIRAHIKKRNNIIAKLNNEIIERKKAEELVKAGEELLRTTLDKIGDNAWEHNFNTKETFFSDRIEDFLGYKKNEFKDNVRLWWNSTHIDDKWMLEKNDEAYKSGHTDQHALEYRIYHKDGSIKWVLDRGHVIEKNDDGTPRRIIGTHTDITQRKITEQALIDSERKFKDLAQNIPGVVYQWIERSDGSYEFIYVSPKLKEYFGVEPSDMNKIVELIHPDDFKNWRTSIEESKNSGSDWDFSGRFLYPDGKIKWWRGTSTISKKTETEIICNGLIRDITDRKLEEQKLSNFNLQLQNKNKELEQFTYIASHDLQEPLRTITGFITLLENDFENKDIDTIKYYFKFISQAADRMSKLIKSLLDYSRIGTQKQLQLADCNNLLKNTKEDLHAAIHNAGAIIYNEELPTINVYVEDFRLLLQNLISNAIKFRKPNEQPIISVAAKQQNDEWLFSIADNGIGVDAKFKDRIFSIFQRLHTKDEYEGTGIGLAHCKKIVELHNGKIWIESTLGEGSTFYFTIGNLS